MAAGWSCVGVWQVSSVSWNEIRGLKWLKWRNYWSGRVVGWEVDCKFQLVLWLIGVWTDWTCKIRQWWQRADWRCNVFRWRFSANANEIRVGNWLKWISGWKSLAGVTAGIWERFVLLQRRQHEHRKIGDTCCNSSRIFERYNIKDMRFWFDVVSRDVDGGEDNMNYDIRWLHVVFRGFYNMKGLIWGFDVVWIADSDRWIMNRSQQVLKSFQKVLDFVE